MKKLAGKLVLGLACLGCLSAPAQAFEEESASYLTREHGVHVDMERKALTRPFMGQDVEEGLVEFFVKKSEAQANFAEPYQKQANRFAPAMGVQFRLKF